MHVEQLTAEERVRLQGVATPDQQRKALRIIDQLTAEVERWKEEYRITEAARASFEAAGVL